MRRYRDQTFRKADVVRAFKAAECAGVPNPRIEIDSVRKTLTIIPTEPPKDSGDGNALDQWMANRADQTERH